MVSNVESSFLGLAIGDALGVPVETKSRGYLRDHPVTDMIGYGSYGQPAGTWSDDSSMTFCTAESLIKGYNREDIGKTFARWWKEAHWSARGLVFDIGRITMDSLDRIAAGEKQKQWGKSDINSNGNGSLMRILPCSLYFADVDDDELFDRIKEVSSITHGHFISIFSCFIYSKLISAILKGNDKMEAYFLTVQQVNRFIEVESFPMAYIIPFKRILSTEIVMLEEHHINSGGYVIDTLEAGIWSFLTTNSYKDAVLKAVNLGRDTDTTACVTGGLAGLYYGLEAIPQDWILRTARIDDIRELARRFAEALEEKEDYNQRAERKTKSKLSNFFSRLFDQK